MNTKTRILAACALSAIASTAMAQTYSTVNPPPSGEKNHAQILRDIYGSNFTLAGNGRDYTSGTVTAQRLADFGAGGPASLSSGTTSSVDSFWTGASSFVVTAKAKFAADNSQFGYIDDSVSNPAFQSLFNTGSLNSETTVTVSGPFRWALKNLSQSMLLTSNPNDNRGTGWNEKLDQLVTYSISRPGLVGAEWVLCWEDRVKRDCSDYDYNDAVIVINARPIPAPASAALVGFGGMTMLRRRRR